MCLNDFQFFKIARTLMVSILHTVSDSVFPSLNKTRENIKFSDSFVEKNMNVTVIC